MYSCSSRRKMTVSLAALVVLSLLVRSSSQEECGCCGFAQQLISDDLVDISANPLLEGLNTKVDPMKVEISEDNGNNPWCSAVPSGQTAYYPYLTFEFSSIYLIELVTISGRYHLNTYVIALTIQNDTGQGFTFINDNGVPKVFDTNLNHGGDVRNISFMDKPVLATSLQIRAHTWTPQSPCMRIELYGCLYDNSESYNLIKNIIPILNQESPTSGDVTDTVQSNINTERDVDLTILIAVGIGMAIFGALVATTAILVFKGVVYCCKKTRSTNANARIYSTNNEAYGVAEKHSIELQANECYIPVSPQVEQTEHEDLEYTYPVLPSTANTAEH